MPLSDLSKPEVLFRETWDAHARRSADGTPILPASFVARADARVWTVDVREDHELTGPHGHVPGTLRYPLAKIGDLHTLLPTSTAVVLVCDDGRRSGTAARYLTELGMSYVAAMDDGMSGWRTQGYVVSRDPAARSRHVTIPAPNTGSDGRPLVAAAGDRHLDGDRILEHLGEAMNVTRVKLAGLLTASKTSCVDGREPRASIGTPGGDAGELVLGLAAAEKVGGATLDLGNMGTITQAFADAFGGIYLHTDNHAVNRLVQTLRGDPRLESAVAGRNTIAEWETFLRRPPIEVREALLEHLGDPSHVGCGHLKLALNNPDTYGIRPEIVRHFFRAFYEALWAGASDFEWVVLGGDHAEGAVVNVTQEGDLTPFAEVPMVAPSIGGVQMFVNHPEVIGYLRQQTAHLLHGRLGHLVSLGKTDAAGLAGTIGEMGGEQAMATLKALAAGLPLFDAHFGLDGKVSVTQSGSIPTA